MRWLFMLMGVATVAGCATVSTGLHTVGGLIRDITPKEEGFLNTVGNISADVHQWGGKVIGDAGRETGSDAGTTATKAGEAPAPAASAPVAAPAPEATAAAAPQPAVASAPAPVTKAKPAPRKDPVKKGGTK